MGVPVTHWRPYVTGQRPAHAPAGAETSGSTEDTLSWPAPHLRNAGTAKRCGHQDRVWYAGAFFSRLHAGQLRPCNDLGQAWSSKNNGQHSIWRGIVLSATRSRLGQRLGQGKQRASYRAKKCEKSPEILRFQDFSGCGDRTRTCDLRVMSSK